MTTTDQPAQPLHVGDVVDLTFRTRTRQYVSRAICNWIERRPEGWYFGYSPAPNAPADYGFGAAMLRDAGPLPFGLVAFAVVKPACIGCGDARDAATLRDGLCPSCHVARFCFAYGDEVEVTAGPRGRVRAIFESLARLRRPRRLRRLIHQPSEEIPMHEAFHDRVYEWRCTRHAPYAHDCPGRDNARLRQGHYLFAPTREAAIAEMAISFPDDVRKGFTFTADRVDDPDAEEI